jgi:hypothetical protein
VASATGSEEDPQFSKSLTKQSVAPVVGLTAQGLDRSGAAATENDGVTFAEIDAIYFADVMAGTSFNMLTPNGKNVMGNDVPTYSDPNQRAWISLDYSLQLAISLTQWMQWQAAQKAQVAAAERTFIKALRRAAE